MKNNTYKTIIEDVKKSGEEFADNASALSFIGNNNSKKTGRGNQGFASMSKERQREIASKGGKAAHAQGTAHEWSSSEAADAGRKGGKNKSQKVA